MARIYTLEEKERAMELLREKGGDVPYVSYLTGISERTLYSWRKFERYEKAEEPPLHWIRQQPERQERLQQQQEQRQQQQQRQHQMTAFGMTYEELQEALKVEYMPGDLENLHADLMLHLKHLNFSLTDDPATAHHKALAFSRMLSDALRIEDMIRIQKPQISIIKYEYPDQTYHDVPYWSNAVHLRASEAYDTVIANAKREYEAQQAALHPSPAPAYTPLPSADMEELLNAPTLEEILAKPFTPEDFIPKHTGFLKHFLGEDPYAPNRNASSEHSENSYATGNNSNSELGDATGNHANKEAGEAMRDSHSNENQRDSNILEETGENLKNNHANLVSGEDLSASHANKESDENPYMRGNHENSVSGADPYSSHTNAEQEASNTPPDS